MKLVVFNSRQTVVKESQSAFYRDNFVVLCFHYKIIENNDLNLQNKNGTSIFKLDKTIIKKHNNFLSH